MSTAASSAPTGSRKAAITAAAAAAVEWYDFFIYGTAAALVFPHLFFPASMSPFVAQIASFSTFAVGFVARPLGGVLFGHFGDIHGRKRALMVAITLMGIATTAIGLLPSYERIGVWAPLLLIGLRFAQGLAVGGQWGGAALLAIESAPAPRRGYYGSFVQVGVPIGVVLANAVFLVISAVTDDTTFLAWGWRVAFILSVVLIFIGVAINTSVEEDMAPAVERPRGSPIIRAVRLHWREILLAGGAFVANNTCFYVAITYAVGYATNTVGLSRDVPLFAVMFTSVLMGPVLLACGALSDRYGRRGIFLLGAALSGLWAFAVFPLIDTGSVIAVVMAIGVELLLLSLMYGPQAALFAELFPKSIRYSGASLGYQFGAIVGGGFAPIIATALFAEYRSTLPISIYLAIMCLISFFSVLIMGGRANARAAD
jgi:MFS family permease